LSRQLDGPAPHLNNKSFVLSFQFPQAIMRQLLAINER